MNLLEQYDKVDVFQKILLNDTSGLDDVFQTEDSEHDKILFTVEEYHKLKPEDDTRPECMFDLGLIYNGEIPKELEDKNNGVKVLKCSEIFVGTSLEHGIDTQVRVQHLIVSNYNALCESIDEEGWKYNQEYIIVAKVKPFTVNGITYSYVLVSGHHRFLNIVRRSQKIYVLEGVFDTEAERKEFATIYANDYKYIAKNPYSFDDAKRLIKQFQREGHIGNDYESVRKYIEPKLRGLKKHLKVSYDILAKRLCDDLGVSYLSYQYDKKALEAEVKHLVKNNVIKTYSKNGNLDDNEERGYTVLVDHETHLRTFVTEYYLSLAENKDHKIHNLYCGFSNDILSEDNKEKLSDIKDKYVGKINKLMTKIAKGAKLFNEGHGGKLNINWVATNRETEEQGKQFY